MFFDKDILKLFKKRCDITFSIRAFHFIIQGLNPKRKNVSFLTMNLSMMCKNVQKVEEKKEAIIILGNILSRKVNRIFSIQLDWQENKSTHTVLQKDQNSGNYSFCFAMDRVKLATTVMIKNNLLWPSNRYEIETQYLKLPNILGSVK